MAQAQPKALYRKYRGLSFDDIIGQKHITDILQQAITHGRVSHAYLFTGPRGVGKTSVARILAHRINELDYQHEDNHIDIIEIDAASNRRIDEIRDLREKSHIAPVSAKYKVYIIDEVHMLTKEAFNALLKTLEEPPEHVVFILATTEAHKLPATIISRTQRHTFRPINQADMIAHLTSIAQQEKIDITSAALKVISEHADGSFRDAISLLDQVSGIHDDNISEDDVRSLLGLADEQSLATLMGHVRSGEQDAVLAQIQELIESGRQPELLALQLAAYIRKSDDFYDWLDLVEALLAVPTHAEPRMHLEITLLKNLRTATPPQASAQTTAPRPKNITEEPTPPKQDQEATQPDTKTTATEKPKSVQQSGAITDEQWSQIIDDVKHKNNAIASILRNSHADFEEDAVSLKVKFAFHKKKLEGSQASEFIQAAAQTVSGGPINLVMTVDPSAATKKEDTVATSGEEDFTSTIIDTFGGGERVSL